MKKYLLTFLIFTYFVPAVAEMTYDPVYNRIYSNPQSPEINQYEYCRLFLNCAPLIERIEQMNGHKRLSKELFFRQVDDYLRRIGSPAALRLSADIQKNVILYANGDFMREIYY